MSDPTKREVTEADFRLAEYRDAKVEDYEFDSTGELVRKDRWETTVRRIAIILQDAGVDGIGPRYFDLGVLLERIEEKFAPQQQAQAAPITPTQSLDGLVDYLKLMRAWHADSIAVNSTEVQGHIANLDGWIKTLGAPAHINVDYDKLIGDGFAQHGYQQGTPRCVAFARGAEWMMEEINRGLRGKS